MRSEAGKSEEHVELHGVNGNSKCCDMALTSMTATVTTLWKVGMSLSMLRYRSTSDNASFSSSASCGSWTGPDSLEMNSPRSGGTAETIA